MMKQNQIKLPKKQKYEVFEETPQQKEKKHCPENLEKEKVWKKIRILSEISLVSFQKMQEDLVFKQSSK